MHVTKLYWPFYIKLSLFVSLKRYIFRLSLSLNIPSRFWRPRFNNIIQASFYCHILHKLNTSPTFFPFTHSLNTPCGKMFALMAICKYFWPCLPLPSRQTIFKEKKMQSRPVRRGKVCSRTQVKFNLCRLFSPTGLSNMTHFQSASYGGKAPLHRRLPATDARCPILTSA